ncbi:Pirin-domain-containing protein [Clavulina sp. PMI_390]|nr:Pirin-domain-containing protein [Clavulina sp. PMI_390]
MPKDLAPTLAASPKYPNVKIVARPSHERGHADHDWLKTFHTFSFASYYSPLYNSFGALRVINEDRVSPSKGFGRHPHSEMEIFSYIVSGELEHKDSMGNLEIMKRGDVQMTSAGTGIAHSEYNRNSKKPVHFLQIWVQPSQRRLTPKYYTRHFTDEEKANKLVPVVAPLPKAGSSSTPDSSEPNSLTVSDEREGTGPAPIHAGAVVYASILSPGEENTLTHTFQAPAEGEKFRKGYVHVIQTSGYNTGPSKGARVRLNGGLELGEGDGAFVMTAVGDKLEIENVSDSKAELLVFDME